MKLSRTLLTIAVLGIVILGGSWFGSDYLLSSNFVSPATDEREEVQVIDGLEMQASHQDMSAEEHETMTTDDIVTNEPQASGETIVDSLPTQDTALMDMGDVTTDDSPVHDGNTLPAPMYPSISAAEVSTHNSEDSCYTIINNSVYDVTSYLDHHPGGKKAAMKACGVDATKAFESVSHHDGDDASFTLSLFKIGVLIE